MGIVEERHRGTLIPIIQECVAQGTKIHSHEWDAYRGISGTVLVERTGRFIKRKNCLVIGIFLTVEKWIFVTFLCVNSGSYK